MSKDRFRFDATVFKLLDITLKKLLSSECLQSINSIPPSCQVQPQAVQHQPQYRVWLLSRPLPYHYRLGWLLLVSHIRSSKDPLEKFKKITS